MSSSADEQRIIRTERLVLQALCQGTPEGSVWEAGRSILENYRWRDSSHRIFYQVVVSLPTGAPDIIREQLPARLTRRGFPDMAWEELFEPHPLSKENAESLMRELVRAE